MPRKVKIKYGAQGSGSVGGAAARGIGGSMRKLKVDVDSELERIVGEAANIVLDEAVGNAPEDTGALRASGRVEVHPTPSGADAFVAFGGDFSVSPTKNAPQGIVFYAAFVHEDMQRSYKTGGPKYLENAIRDTRDQVDAFVFDELRKLLESAGVGR